MSTTKRLLKKSGKNIIVMAKGLGEDKIALYYIDKKLVATAKTTIVGDTKLWKKYLEFKAKHKFVMIP